MQLIQNIKSMGKLDLATSGLVFLFAPPSLVFNGGYTFTPLILLLIALPFLFMKKSYHLSRESWWLIGALIFYFVIYLGYMLIFHGEMKELDRPSRALMAIIILLMLLRHPPRKSWLLPGFACGAIISGLFACYQKFFLHMWRALSNNMPIQAGDICMAFGTISLVALFYQLKRQQYGWAVFYLIASALGILGSLLSGSRGGWVMLPFILVYLLWSNRSIFSGRLKIAVAIIVAIFIGACFIPQTGLPQKVHSTITNITQFQDGGNKNTSIGVRFQLWSSAWRSFTHKPVIGWSQWELCQDKTRQYNQGEISPYLYTVWACNMHAHSEYFDAMQKRGVIGLVQIFAVFFIPLVIFIRTYKRREGLDSTIALAGVMMVISTMGFSLSQLFFGHNSGSVFYTAALIFIYASLSNRNIQVKPQ